MSPWVERTQTQRTHTLQSVITVSSMKPFLPTVSSLPASKVCQYVWIRHDRATCLTACLCVCCDHTVVQVTLIQSSSHSSCHSITHPGPVTVTRPASPHWSHVSHTHSQRPVAPCKPSHRPSKPPCVSWSLTTCTHTKRMRSSC